MCPLAIVEVVVVCIIAFLPTAPGGIPGNAAFHWNNGLINYCPIIVGVVALYAVVSWFVSAKNWFKGPIRTVDLPPRCPPPATERDLDTCRPAPGNHFPEPGEIPRRW